MGVYCRVSTCNAHESRRLARIGCGDETDHPKLPHDMSIGIDGR